MWRCSVSHRRYYVDVIRCQANQYYFKSDGRAFNPFTIINYDDVYYSRNGDACSGRLCSHSHVSCANIDRARGQCNGSAFVYRLLFNYFCDYPSSGSCCFCCGRDCERKPESHWLGSCSFGHRIIYHSIYICFSTCIAYGRDDTRNDYCDGSNSWLDYGSWVCVHIWCTCNITSVIRKKSQRRLEKGRQITPISSSCR